MRHDLRTARLQREKAEHESMLAERVARMREAATPDEQDDKKRKQAIIQAAMERARPNAAEKKQS